MSALPNQISYTKLSENGLKLSEIEFNAIISEVEKGILETRQFLNTKDEGPTIVFSEKISVIGYSYELDAINIPLNYLNLVSQNKTPIEYRDQLVCFVPDKFYMILKYLSWLKYFGIEESVHYYQRHGDQKLLVKFPESFPENLSPKSLLLSDLEVETRTIVDKISTENKDIPIWENVDKYFSDNFPEYFNLPIEHLSTLPKPNLEISFEMENLQT